MFGCTVQNKMLRDGSGGSVVNSIGTMVVTTWNEQSLPAILDFAPTLSNFSAAAGGSARIIMETLSGGSSGSNFYDIMAKLAGPVNIVLSSQFEGQGKAALELGSNGTSAALRVGTSTDAGYINPYYDFRRENNGADPDVGYLKITGNQAGYTGYVFNGPVKTTDDAYASTWDGSLAVPTKNAVYDKIETIGLRVAATTSSTTPTPNMDTTDLYALTALAPGATFAAPTGTLVNGRKLTIRVKDNGTARSLAWNTVYRAVGVTLPTTTTISKTLYVGCIYNSADTKWDVVSVAQEA